VQLFDGVFTMLSYELDTVLDILDADSYPVDDSVSVVVRSVSLSAEGLSRSGGPGTDCNPRTCWR
jgi:hypothetical protein